MQRRVAQGHQPPSVSQQMRMLERDYMMKHLGEDGTGKDEGLFSELSKSAAWFQARSIGALRALQARLPTVRGYRRHARVGPAEEAGPPAIPEPQAVRQVMRRSMSCPVLGDV